jgi:hypothetical protein
MVHPRLERLRARKRKEKGAVSYTQAEH